MAYTNDSKHLLITDGPLIHASYESFDSAESAAQAHLSNTEIDITKVWIVPVTEITEVA